MINKTYNIDIVGDVTLHINEIRKINGVNRVEYNSHSSNASISIDKSYEDDAAEILQETVRLIRQSGGSVKTDNIVQPVLNMTCAACASSSQNILLYVPGVVSASVNYGNGKGAIEYLPGVVSPEEMKSSQIGRAHV